jgi:hypothetical protein
VPEAIVMHAYQLPASMHIVLCIKSSLYVSQAIDAKRLVERAQRMCPTDLGRQLSKECEAAAEKDPDESNATSRYCFRLRQSHGSRCLLLWCTSVVAHKTY